MKEDWVKCSFGEIINFRNGFAFKSNAYSREGIPVIRIGDIKESEVSIINAVRVKASKEFANYSINYGDILIAMSGATTGKFGMYKGVDLAYQNQRVGNIFPRDSGLIYKPFTFYLLHSLKRQIEKDAYGGAQPNISSKRIEELSIYLPPLPIQRAIVKKIEQLFSALDAGIADLRKAQEQLKVYRQAVLKKAFGGIEQTMPLAKAGVWKGGGTPSTQKKEYWEGGEIPWVSSQDVKSMYVYNTERTITDIAIENSSTKWINKGALIFVVRSGILRRIFPIAIAKVDLCVNQDIQTVTLTDEYYPEFLFWYLTAHEYDIRHKCSKDGTTVESIDVLKLKSYHIPYCDKSQQKQIIKEIESRLSVCDALEHQINSSLQQSEVLRQSILKNAFAGELLTQMEIAACKQEPDYEPASSLLERIKDEKGKVKTISKKITSSQEIKPAIVKASKISADIHAGLIAKIIKLHETKPDYRDKLSHIKCEKIAHLVEYHAQVPLGRQPVKDAAGPDDYPHLKKVESRAIKAGFFKIKKNNIGYTYLPGNQIDAVIQKFENSLSTDQSNKVNALLQLFLQFDLEQAEIAATTYAGWNNLIILGNSNPSDEEIVTESRENWSARKLKISRERFFNAINWLRKKEVNLIPTGYGLLVPSPLKK